MLTATQHSKDVSALSLQASISNDQLLIDKWQAQYSHDWMPSAVIFLQDSGQELCTDKTVESLTLGFHTASLHIQQPIIQFRAMLARWYRKDEDKKTDDFAARVALFHRRVSGFHWVFGSFLDLSKEEFCAIPVFQLTSIIHALFLLIMIETRERSNWQAIRSQSIFRSRA